MTSTRQFFTVMHRWAGLYLALWLSIVGLTGAVLAFFPELERTFAPPSNIGAEAGQSLLSAEQLVQAAKARAKPGMVVGYVSLKVEPDAAFRVFFTASKTKAGAEPESEEILLNPYTSAIIVDESEETLAMTILFTIYDLHYTLLLGEVGRTILGISALVWTIDCFVGGYLTFPVRRKAAVAGQKSWFHRWRPSWLIRRKTNGYKFSFDLHRAGGLWVWAMLLVFAWSSVAFNLGQVYTPVMKVFGYQDFEVVNVSTFPSGTAIIDWQHALKTARADVSGFGAQNGFTVKSENGMNYDIASGLYRYNFVSSADVGNIHTSEIVVDGRSGAVVQRLTAANRPIANAVTDWILALHMARWGGLAFKIFVCFMGLLITALCVTGIIIWMKKRGARLKRAA